MQLYDFLRLFNFSSVKTIYLCQNPIEAFSKMWVGGMEK